MTLEIGQLMNAAAAYVHVPFCRHRCGYCDFTLLAGRDELMTGYVPLLEREIDLWFRRLEIRDKPRLKTLYFGGGTPTHLPAQQLTALFAGIARRFEMEAGAEVTVEANPLDLTDERLEVLSGCGVNRLSLGVQSFQESDLLLLERDHRPEEIPRMVQRAQQRVANVSIDLIFGVPGQTLATWKESLQRAVDLGVTHLSTYGLTFETGTAFETRRRRGLLSPVAEELEAEMYEWAMDYLPTQGFEQYEISNFAREGYRSRHNSVYWSGDDYWGFGPGGASFLGGIRRMNQRNVLGWFERLTLGELAIADEEQLSRTERAHEYLVFALRQMAGVSSIEFETRTGFSLCELIGERLPPLLTSGWLVEDQGRLRLTRAGKLLADSVAAKLL